MRRFLWLVPVLAMAGGVFWLKPGDAQQAIPNYDQEPNKLIDRKLVEPNPGDPQWLVDGKFYDVGRNPEPKPGQGGPPSGSTPTEWGDYRFRVTHIKFDYSPDVGPGDEPGEGLEIQYRHSSGPGNQLAHILDDRVKGEWIYKWSDDPDKGRHEPALYACKESVKVKVRIECANPIASAEIGAKQVTPSSGQRPDWRDVNRTRVDFIETAPGSNRWVSKGPLNDPSDPSQGFSEYVDMSLSAPIRDDINKTQCIWQWYVDGTSAAGNPPGTPRYAKDVCKNNMEGWEINRSEGYEVVTNPDDGTTTEVEVPHTFYTVLGKPNNPYYRIPDGPLTTAFPWVTALEFAIVTDVKLAGIKKSASVINSQTGEVAEVGAADKIANFCYKDYGLSYSHRGDGPMWVDASSLGQRAHYFFNFTSFINSGGNRVVICFDQACSVATLIDLTCGVDATVHWLPEFGYVNKTGFVGGQECNNPFWEKAGFVTDKIVPEDDTMWRVDAGGLVKRSAFACHCWCEANRGTVYDATVGKLGASAAALIVAGRTAYRAQVCDVSQTNPPWRDDERVPLKRNGWNPTSPPEPWLVAGYQDANYAIDVDDEGDAVTHANFARIKTKDIEIG